ncbi:outer membrane protein assembly factor BamE domain-containing protein [Sulfuriferula nivalis]|uniref:Outer membrane protein assembly factor BamE domain-containing protein n=1 Tax=Sulfuriferula nivalis TaxID=2675298 RepID=A0A809SEP9_9PROT|nr:outer membrane protein assembly factor BamE [Sulfuriferula nivalis]BBP01617.1 hypothetical protein SFSGTM_23250 [Sulfuriferula nivalis]
MKILSGILLVLLLSACASYSGRGLQPDVAGYDDVIRVMGQPTMHWQNADGTRQLIYPRGSMHTYMAVVAADGKLKSIENVLDEQHFSQIQPGMTKEQVLRILGPSVPAWTVYYASRDELAWEWRYCNAWRQSSRFDVLFDATQGVVRSSMGMTESQRGMCGISECMC